MGIKEKLIKYLGGFTHNEYYQALNGEEQDELTQRIIPICAEVKSYCIDDDNLLYDKTQIAREIGEQILENNLIDFTIKQKQDKFGSRIYRIRGKVFVNEIKH